jgi:hypothetical protein
LIDKVEDGRRYFSRFISAIAVASGKPNVIYLGYSGGEVFVTANGIEERPDWVEGVGLPPRYCHQIVPDPAAPDKVAYATFGSYHEAVIWKTVNGGRHWNALPPIEVSPEYWRRRNLQPELLIEEKPKPVRLKVPVYTLAIHPDNSNWLYIGTEAGVLASEDGGKKWGPTNEGPANCRVNDLIWLGKTLVAVTHARGLFAIDLTLRTGP